MGCAFQSLEDAFQALGCTFETVLYVFGGFEGVFERFGNALEDFGKASQANGCSFAHFQNPVTRHLAAVVEAEGASILFCDIDLLLDFVSFHFSTQPLAIGPVGRYRLDFSFL